MTAEQLLRQNCRNNSYPYCPSACSKVKKSICCVHCKYMAECIEARTEHPMIQPHFCDYLWKLDSMTLLILLAENRRDYEAKEKV
jgi:hypothetical protein